MSDHQPLTVRIELTPPPAPDAGPADEAARFSQRRILLALAVLAFTSLIAPLALLTIALNLHAALTGLAVGTLITLVLTPAWAYACRRAAVHLLRES